MDKKVTGHGSTGHRHEWMLRDPFNFDGPVFECRCGQKRVEVDTVAPPLTDPWTRSGGPPSDVL